MFGLRIPVTQSVPVAEFDTVQTILTHSSYREESSFWSSKVNERGEIFFLELTEEQQWDKKGTLHQTDSVCSCSGCATDDTGYGTDSDQLSNKSQNGTPKTARALPFVRSSLTCSSSSESSLENDLNRHTCGRTSLDRSTCGCVLEEDELPRMNYNVKEIVLKLTHRTKSSKTKGDKGKSHGDRDRTLCEELLGIVPGHFRTKGQTRSRKDKRIRVQGLVPHGAAIQHGQIRIGDCLKSVSGQDVTWDNIDSVLESAAASKQVRLLVQKVTQDRSHGPVLVKKNSVPRASQLVHFLNGDNGGSDNSQSYSHYAAMYLTLDGLSSEDVLEKEDVAYQFPQEDNKLVAIRGLFITLSHCLEDVTDSCAKRSSLVHDSRLVNVGYHREGQDLFVLVLPEDMIHSLVLTSFVCDVVRLLQVLYGSVKEAFTNPNNRKQLDVFFTLLYHGLHASQSKGDNLGLKHGLAQSEKSLCSVGKVQYLPLREEIKMNIDNVLCGFDSADFLDMSDSFYGCRRSYTIMGSCLFYKGCMLCNHLPKEDSQDIVLYLRHQGLLLMSSDCPVGQLVVWREVFPTRQCHAVREEQMFGYSEPVHGRWFLMVVGMKHMLLCSLLEIAGCAKRRDGIITPDPFYIDQARATLMQLDNLDIMPHCEERLSSGTAPPVISADSLCPKQGVKKDLTNGPPSSTNPTNNNKKSDAAVRRALFQSSASSRIQSEDNLSSIEGSLGSPRSRAGVSLPNGPRHLRGPRKDSLESDTSNESSGSESWFKVPHRNRQFPGSYEFSGLKRLINEPPLGDNKRKVTVGAENCLLHFLHLDRIEGVYITPPGPESDSAMFGPVHEEVMTEFYRCCTQIRHMFDTSRNKRDLIEEKDPKLGLDESFLRVREHGVLFQCYSPADIVRKSPMLTYWVVGRRISRFPPQELYVCFPDATPQTAVELAFKLGLGLLPS